MIIIDIVITIMISLVVWETIKKCYKKIVYRKVADSGEAYQEIPLGSMYVQSTVLRQIADDIEKIYPGKTTVEGSIFVVKLNTMDVLGINIPIPKEIQDNMKNKKEK